jgi:parvulin-like peptidyl-prolyl isomerase
LTTSSNTRLIWIIWVLTALVVALTVVVALGIGKRNGSSVEGGPADLHGSEMAGMVVARVDSAVLYQDDLDMLSITDPGVVSQWVDDQLLADMALERGLENPRKSRLLQQRARQVYLRDRLLNSAYARIPFPDSATVFDHMRSDSEAYLVERHYYQILLADSAMADSVHTRLSWGESFQITAERLSIGQKAGLGGDLGYLTAGELMAYGIPREDAVLDGLGEPVETPYGWHIFLVDDERTLEDTSRVMYAVADDLYRNRMSAVRDSLVEFARQNREVYIDPAYGVRGGPETADAEGTEESEIQ